MPFAPALGKPVVYVNANGQSRSARVNNINEETGACDLTVDSTPADVSGGAASTTTVSGVSVDFSDPPGSNTFHPVSWL